ncbi:MAG TPA: glutamine--fructose-6-phosphate transaminase (isomerizing) [archaeon]|nr:glutamine--fructose-6-phosphate transaminase (isomerizing) [archaeon]
MCGIVGVVSLDNAPFKALAGLKKLEYRGYDSWGISFKNCDTIETVKKTGRITMPARGTLNHNSYAAIAHTRWATHGKVTEKNAHPHVSNDEKIAIVHNGIIENYAELKQKLIEKNFKFYSETDSEVIANLIQFHLAETKNFPEAVKKTILELEGSYAIVALHNKTFEMVAAKNGSPLVIGIGNKEFFAASDVTAFLAYTKKVVYLNDNEIAVFGNTLKIENILTNEKVEPIIHEITWSAQQAEKGNYDYFMRKEIDEQPAIIELTAKQDPDSINKFSNFLKIRKRIFLLGCGSSYHACVLGAEYFNSAGLEAYPFLASEFRQNLNGNTDVILAVSQSGETADLIESINYAKKNHVPILSVVNVMDSTIMRMSDATLLLNAGPEICVLSTKTFSAQVAILYFISKIYGGYINENKRIEVALNELKNNFHIVANNLNSYLNSPNEKIISLAKKLASRRELFVIGRSLAYPLALEAALKIREVSYINAVGFAGGELKHGTIALIEEGTPVIVLSTPETRKSILNNAIEIKSRGGFIIGVDSENSEIYDEYIEIPSFDSLSSIGIIGLILPIQLLAYHLALEKKLDPDKPRNLAKSCTVK